MKHFVRQRSSILPFQYFRNLLFFTTVTSMIYGITDIVHNIMLLFKYVNVLREESLMKVLLLLRQMTSFECFCVKTEHHMETMSFPHGCFDMQALYIDVNKTIVFVFMVLLYNDRHVMSEAKWFIFIFASNIHTAKYILVKQ